MFLIHISPPLFLNILFYFKKKVELFLKNEEIYIGLRASRASALILSPHLKPEALEG